MEEEEEGEAYVKLEETEKGLNVCAVSMTVDGGLTVDVLPLVVDVLMDVVVK